MKKVLNYAILAGLFLLVPARLVPIANADEEKTPVPVETPDIATEDDAVDSLTETDELPPYEETVESFEETPVDYFEPTEGTEPYETDTVETETVETDAVETVLETEVQDSESPTATTDPTPVSDPADPLAISAKVIVVDREASTVTLEFDGELTLVNITPQTRIMKKGRLVALKEIVPGQTINLLARKFENGDLEVVSVAIGPEKDRVEAAASLEVEPLPAPVTEVRLSPPTIWERFLQVGDVALVEIQSQSPPQKISPPTVWERFLNVSDY